MMNKLSKWQSKLNLNEWEFTTKEILPEQVVYDNNCPDEDKYFVGIDVLKKDRNHLS